MASVAPATTQTSPPIAAPLPRASVALWVLMAVATVNFIDRQVVTVLIEPIRAEMHFSDTQFGLLTGLAFALFYAAMGLPVARLADRWNRVRLIAGACTLWSIFTMTCGLAQSFGQFALSRFGVGVGEAGGTAPTLSLLADYYPPARRPLVIGIFSVNGPLGVFLGAAFGGWAAQQFGWRGAFVAVGALGILVVPVLLLLVREPPRGGMDSPAAAAAPMPSLLDCIGMFARQRSLFLLMIASGLSAFVSYGLLNWIPAFLMRTQHMPLSALSLWFAPAAGISMGIGIWGGGALVNAAVRTSPRAYALVPALASLVMAPLLFAALNAGSWQWSLALLIVPMMCCTVYIAPALALVQNLAPPRARATASAILLLMFNLVGLGGGPLAIGMISDAVAPTFGDASLRIALMATIPVALAAMVAQYALSKVVAADLRAQADGETA
jgi:predicted MFS family arabinose efflux permease